LRFERLQELFVDAKANPQDPEKIAASSLDSDTTPSLPLQRAPELEPPPPPQPDLFSRIPLPSGVGDPFLNPSQITSELGYGFNEGFLGQGAGLLGQSGLGQGGGGSLLSGPGQGLLSGQGQGLLSSVQTQGPSLLANVDLAFAPARPLPQPQFQMPVVNVEPPKWVYMDPQGVVQGEQRKRGWLGVEISRLC
jgi:hypothetical protein